MLFSNDTLDGLANGRVNVAFRRWKSARVKTGTRLRTRIGLVEVTSIAEVDPAEVGDDDVAAAGFANRAQLDGWIRGREGMLFRIGLRPSGPDPRIELRNDDDLSAIDLDRIGTRLARMDRSAGVAWTSATLGLIRTNPGVVSTELAAGMLTPRPLFKERVRKLKELGLTESLRIGYRISPRGLAVLRHLDPSDGDSE